MSFSFLVSMRSDDASQMSQCSCGILGTSFKLHGFIHSTSLTELNILPGTVLGSGDRVMKRMDNGGVWRSD